MVNKITQLEIPLECHKNGKYRVITCKTGHIEQILMTKEDKERLAPADVDFHFDYTNGQLFVKTQKGKIKDYSKTFPFGPCAWEMVEQVLRAAGDFVNLESANYVSATLARIRKVLDDHFKDEHFLITRRNPVYSVRLNVKRCWRLIQYVNEKTLKDCNSE